MKNSISLLFIARTAMLFGCDDKKPMEPEPSPDAQLEAVEYAVPTSLAPQRRRKDLTARRIIGIATTPSAYGRCLPGFGCRIQMAFSRIPTLGCPTGTNDVGSKGIEERQKIFAHRNAHSRK
jgi:hypothetical protein